MDELGASLLHSFFSLHIAYPTQLPQRASGGDTFATFRIEDDSDGVQQLSVSQVMSNSYQARP